MFLVLERAEKNSKKKKSPTEKYLINIVRLREILKRNGHLKIKYNFFKKDGLCTQVWDVINAIS